MNTLQAVIAEEFNLSSFETIPLTDVYYSEGANGGDINGDGILDAVYGPYWFAGPDFKTKHEIYPAKPQNLNGYADNFFCWVADFNGDGKQDVLTAGFPGTPGFVYENPGAEGWDQPWKKHQVVASVANEAPQFLDIVGDERPELICTSDGFYGFAIVDWENGFAPWKFHAISDKTAPNPFGHGLGVGDINGDGKNDLLCVDGWYEQPAQEATTNRWEFHPFKFGNAYGGAEMHAYDVDGDGDQDVITSLAAHDFGLAWFEQITQEDTISFKQHLIMGSQPAENRYGLVISELHSVALVDMDGDGLKDIVTGKTFRSHHSGSPMWDAGAVAYWFRLVRTDQGVDWIPFLAAADTGIGRQLSVLDMNADQIPDLVVGGMKGAHVILQQRKSVDKVTWEQAQPKIVNAVMQQAVEAKTASGTRAAIDPATGRVAGAIEGETIKVLSVSSGKAAPQGMGGFPADKWSGDSQLWWTGGEIGAKLELEFTVEQAGEYDLLAVMTKARDYGIFQAHLDGKPIGETFDLFNNPDVITTGVVKLTTEKLEAGKHQITFEVVGANAAAVKAYMFALDYLYLWPAGQTTAGELPQADDGRILNLDFETGSLADWTAEGNAFTKQPVKGDTVQSRRKDMSSRHQGEFWIGTFEFGEDQPQGSLTSLPFKVSQRWASFLLGGGSNSDCRVELLSAADDKVLFKYSGQDVEDMQRVVVDLEKFVGQLIKIRLVDQSSGPWGHINFDDFRFHAAQPGLTTPTKVGLTLDEYPFQGLPADEAANAMKLPDGFSVQVMAHEPDILQPIAMAIDERGRVWVAEAFEYPVRAPEGKGKDRILIFEDSDGDGYFDQRTVFAEGLNLVSGLEVGFGGVWVGAAPYLMFIPDKNGDDVPDAEPQILMDGWGYQDTHETLNTFIWGPDGWLYGCHGVFTHSKVGKPGTPDKDRIPLNAGVWRYHPIRHQFEVFAHGSSNPWGVDFDDHGQAFCTACVIPHLFHFIQGARYQRQGGQHFNPFTYDDIKTIADHRHYLGAVPHAGNNRSDEAGGGHAHAGAMIYLGGTWPEKYRNQIFMNNIHGQRLNMDTLHPDGSGFVGSHGPDFLLTGDMASQILNLRYGPDGNAYMIDWYDMNACHHGNVNGHDRSNGRIYKIVYGKTQQQTVDLRKLTDDQLIALTLDKNDWHVRHARKVLQERAAEGKLAADVDSSLWQIATTNDDDTRRLRAMWALHVTGGINQARSLQLTQDASPYVRAWAIQLAFESPAGQSKALLARMNQLAQQDDSQIVRLYLASALQRIAPADRWSIIESLVAHPVDAHDHNLPFMYWYAMEPLTDVDADRALALGLVAGQAIPLLREFTLRKIGSKGTPDSLEPLVRGLRGADSVELQLTFIKAIRSALSGERSAKPPSGWDEIFQQLQAVNDSQVKLQTNCLAAKFGNASAKADLISLLENSTASLSDRGTALEALLDVRDQKLVETLQQLIADSQIRAQALRGLAQFDDAQTAKTILDQYASFSPEEKRLAVATLCSRENYAVELLQAIEANKIPKTDLSADLARQLSFLKSERVEELLAKAWGSVRETSADKARLIEEYRKIFHDDSLPDADLAQGRAIFSKTCLQCHLLYGVGGQVGPDLTGSNRSDLNYLLTNIVDPSAVMAKEYQPTLLELDDGRVLIGIVNAEDDRTVTLKTAAELITVAKREIVDRALLIQSMMPEDQLKQFTPAEIRSLLAYLSAKQQTPILADAENAGAFFNATNLAGWRGDESLWRVENGEIIGRTSGLDHNEFLVSEMSARDFKLQLEIKLIDDAGNSGIQFRSQPADHGEVKGYQADAGPGWWGKLYEELGRGLLWEKSGEEFVHKNDWNKYEIQAVGSEIKTWINGHLCVDLEDPDGARQGVFALQLHSGGPTEVRFRNLKLEVVHPDRQ
jgi:putative membrane-bound dehydrogenase-like protein